MNGPAPGLSPTRSLLLVDLDGVIALEVAVTGSAPELLRLHRDPVASLLRFGCEVVVLTHRSAAEARTILRAVGLPASGLAGVIGAESILMEGLRQRRFGTLLHRGLRKSLVLPLIERKFGVERSHVAFIDDRPDNLDDLVADGLGLAILAPSEWAGDGRIGTFHFDEAAQAFAAWSAQRRPAVRVALNRIEVDVEPWRRSGLCTTSSARSLFNQLRRIGGSARRRLFPLA